MAPSWRGCYCRISYCCANVNIYSMLKNWKMYKCVFMNWLFHQVLKQLEVWPFPHPTWNYRLSYLTSHWERTISLLLKLEIPTQSTESRQLKLMQRQRTKVGIPEFCVEPHFVVHWTDLNWLLTSAELWISSLVSWVVQDTDILYLESSKQQMYAISPGQHSISNCLLTAH